MFSVGNSLNAERAVRRAWVRAVAEGTQEGNESKDVYCELELTRFGEQIGIKSEGKGRGKGDPSFGQRPPALSV